MKVEIQELEFIRLNKPSNFAALISETTGVPRGTVNSELSRIKEDYSEVIITEARRLLKAVKGLEFHSEL